MASLFSWNLHCFYCNSRSAQKYVKGLEKWKCDQCEAFNFLDKNGGITDPPAQSSGDDANAHYARLVPRPGSPIFGSSDDHLFCQTCINNQKIQTESLASYLPPASDPRYKDFERELPVYRKRLDQQYPPVCRQCEPRIKQRLKATGYAAKTDHLRRVMERTRVGAIRRPWQWRHIVLFAGKLAWWGSIAAQVLWDVVGLLPRVDHFGLRSVGGQESLKTCVEAFLLERQVEPECVAMSAVFSDYGLLLGMISIWWNSRLQGRLNGEGGRMVGLSDYYKLQAIAFFARVLAWFVLGVVGLTVQASRVSHAFFLVFFTLTALVSCRAVKIDHTPLFSFHGLDDVSMSGYSADQNDASGAYQSPPDSQRTQQAQSLSHNFPINSLAPSFTDPLPSSYQPPSPPPDDNIDAMDWTPSQKELHLAPSKNLPHNLPGYVQLGPNTISAKVPPAPKSQEARLRNPYLPKNGVSQFEQESAKSPPKGFFRRLGDAAVSPSSLGTKSNGNVSESEGIRISPLRLGVPLSTHREDTGLEMFFDKTFSLSDAPAEVRTKSDARSRTLAGFAVDGQSELYNYDRYFLSLDTFLTACWMLAPFRPELEDVIRIAALAVLSFSSFLATAFQRRAQTQFPVWISALMSLTSSLLAIAQLTLTSPITQDLISLSGTLFVLISWVALLSYYAKSKDAGNRDEPLVPTADNNETPFPAVQSLIAPSPIRPARKHTSQSQLPESSALFPSTSSQNLPPPSRFAGPSQQPPSTQPSFSSLSLTDSNLSSSSWNDQFSSWRSASPTRSEASVATSVTSITDWAGDPRTRKKRGGTATPTGNGLNGLSIGDSTGTGFQGRRGLRSQTRNARTPNMSDSWGL